MISEIIPTFARRPLVGYGWVALATVVTGMLGFGVWVHHMFATGLPQMSMAFFSVASLTIVFPSAVAVFSWIGTIWHGKPVWRTPMLFAAGFIILFVIGGVSGVVTAAIPYDWQVTDSYFVVAHLHYVLVGINVFPVMAAFYYWLPKITGRMMNETLGKWNFWVMFIGFNVGFFPMHIAGLLGMPRRIYTYPAGLGWDAVNIITSIGAWIFAIGVLLFVVNFFWSMQFGERAGDNPWDAGTLEWSTSSPPPEYNFAVIPTIRSRLPLWEGRVMEGQTNPDARSAIWQGPALADGREAVGVSPLDGDPMAVLRMPKDSLAPLLLALSLTGVFYGLVTGIWLMALLFGICVLLCLVGWLWPTSPSRAENEV
jgi:heme/copper-type cytochrome/quinol oxidase subunit 1